MMTEGWRRRQFFLEMQRMEVTFGVAEEVLSSAAIMEEVTLMQSQQGSGDKCDQGTFYGVEIGLTACKDVGCKIEI